MSSFVTNKKLVSNNKNLMPIKYRADIDGLRAIAVLFVIGFHALPNMLKAGFIGVDIFFVISGYLISSIIFSNLEQNRFSLAEFYSRRIRRIFPSLVIVLLFCFVFGWFVLLADEFKQLGKHIVGGAGFVSNFIFWTESGYFDNAADTKPLLHLWSLAIEEQFYIFWPLLLGFVWKKKWSFLRTTALIAATSFVVNIYLIGHKSEHAFYLPIPRFWELMIGGILAQIMLHKPKLNSKYNNLKLFIGLLLLLLSLIFISEKVAFPGWFCLMPTIGSFLIIWAGPNTWFNRNVLSNNILVGVGLISYPLYLWHWPLLTFARIISWSHSPKIIRCAIVILSVVLAWLTYLFIEKPFRFGVNRAIKTIGLIVLMLIVSILGCISFFTSGISSRNVVRVNVLFQSGFEGGDVGITINDCRISDIKKSKLFAFCQRDARQTERFALIGDSKAGTLFPGLVRTSTEKGRWLFIGGNGPPNGPLVPVLSTHEIYRRYQLLASTAVEAITQNGNIETVVLVTSTRALFALNNDSSIEDLPTSKNYTFALEGLLNVTSKIIQSGKKVVIVVDNPTLPNPKDCFKRITGIGFVDHLLNLGKENPKCSIELDLFNDLRKQYINLLLEVLKSNPEKISIFDTTHFFCDLKSGVCPAVSDGHLLYGFTDHMSDYAASKVGKELNEYLTGH